MANTSNEQTGLRIPPFLRQIPQWIMGIVLVSLYGAVAIAIKITINRFFPQFGPSIPMVYVLASISPVVYFNYIELGMRYTKQGRFRFAAKMSYAYLATLFATSLCLAAFYGVWGLAIAACTTELLQAVLLLKFRKSNAAS
jgi:O-antigen/teichoic acid export membrane protein